MATYKVWLTVKDSYGNTKEISGGTINVDLNTLTEDELSNIEEALVLDNYATDLEVKSAVEDVASIRYTDFKLSPHNIVDPELPGLREEEDDV